MTAWVTLDDAQLIATRYLDAEPALVWEVFTTPEHLAAFWGGDHATVPPDSVTVDLRVGGTFALETRGADGSSHLLRFRYEAVDSPTRLVFAEPRTGITTEIRLRPVHLPGAPDRTGRLLRRPAYLTRPLVPIQLPHHLAQEASP